ncbi:DUF6515 family protein [Croceivirga sp. JEA036]|uniref:DUF6515 family protein n=1 Tax=Croceivirga sp. JEA036 TaxID=2721162 RepID=UPI00143A6C51|nr:DUF6515 family protein [Croceivirga sp. JEA036]NJB37952.1 hypothetical protein [Croceivirga sp. JEA036]
MKNVKNVFIVLFLLGGMLMTTAQTTVIRTYPRTGTVVTTIRKPKIVVHKNTRFYFADGVWYNTNNKKYVVVSAPTGLTINRLPRARKVVVVNGKRLYKYRGVFYKKTGRNFVVVNV